MIPAYAEWSDRTDEGYMLYSSNVPVAQMEGSMISTFSESELAYLREERRLGRIATVGKDGTPHVVPVGWHHNTELDAIDVGGHQFERTKKFRDVARSGQAAIVIDDLASSDPWRPRGIEVRGRAEAITDPVPVVRIHPEKIVSWGIESDRVGERSSRAR
jgi:pyridoxamine 5'-phosphate oxidase family protein